MRKTIVSGANREEDSLSTVELTDALYRGFYRAFRHAILLLAGLFLVWQLAGPISGILLLFLLVFVLSAVLNPSVAWLAERGIPRILSATILVFLTLGLVGCLGYLLVPRLLEDIGDIAGLRDQVSGWMNGLYLRFTSQFPQLADAVPPPGEIFSSITPRLYNLFGRMTGYLMNAVTGLFSLLLVLVLVIYTVARPEPLLTGLLAAVPDPQRERVAATIERSMHRIVRWAWASVLDGTIIALLTWGGLQLLGVPHAGLFGVLAGFGELVPVIGPIVAAVPPILYALALDPMQALWVALFFVGLQQIEGNVLVPWIMGEAMELHPVSLLFTLLVMHSLFGILGAILAVPVTGILKVCWEEFYLRPREENTRALEQQAEAVLSPGLDTEEAKEAEQGNREVRPPADERDQQQEDEGPPRRSEQEQPAEGQNPAHRRAA